MQSLLSYWLPLLTSLLPRTPCTTFPPQTTVLNLYIVRHALSSYPKIKLAFQASISLLPAFPRHRHPVVRVILRSSGKSKALPILLLSSSELWKHRGVVAGHTRLPMNNSLHACLTGKLIGYKVIVRVTDPAVTYHTYVSQCRLNLDLEHCC